MPVTKSPLDAYTGLLKAPAKTGQRIPLPQEGTPHPGFEMPIDALLGMLGVGPETKANLAGQLMMAGLPMLHAPFGGGGGVPKPPAGKTAGRMVEGVQTPTSSPLDFYTQPLKPYEELLIRHLDEAVTDRQAGMAQNQYNLGGTGPMINRRDAESRLAYSKQQVAEQKENTRARMRTTMRRTEKQIARGTYETPRREIVRPKPEQPISSTQGAPKVTGKYQGRKPRPISEDQVVSLREWHEAIGSDLPRGEKISAARSAFPELEGVKDSALREIMYGDSYVGVGPHPNWKKTLTEEQKAAIRAKFAKKK